MIASVREFVEYFEDVRPRTWAAVDRVTAERLAWAPAPGEFSCGDIVRHIAGAERFFVTEVVEDRWTDDLDPGAPLDRAATRARLETIHRAEAAWLAGLHDARLREAVSDLEGRPVTVWRFLMAMVEHEVHHRSQLDAYLAAAGTAAPQLYGYRMEDVVARARAATGPPRP